MQQSLVKRVLSCLRCRCNEYYALYYALFFMPRNEDKEHRVFKRQLGKQLALTDTPSLGRSEVRHEMLLQTSKSREVLPTLLE